MPSQKIILDTDIGDDVDDALALGLICAGLSLSLPNGRGAERPRQRRF